MKRIFLLPLTAAAVWCAMPVHADEPVETDSMTPDSMKLYELQQIEVTATRVDRKTPVAYADIGREAISRRNFGSDMPTLLQMTPSVPLRMPATASAVRRSVCAVRMLRASMSQPTACR